MSNMGEYKDGYGAHQSQNEEPHGSPSYQLSHGIDRLFSDHDRSASAADNQGAVHMVEEPSDIGSLTTFLRDNELSFECSVPAVGTLPLEEQECFESNTEEFPHFSHLGIRSRQADTLDLSDDNNFTRTYSSAPLSCDQCSSIFKTSQDLIRHLECCFGKDQFTCTICQFSASSKGSLAKHEKLHWKVKIHCCLCNWPCSSQGVLAHHLKENHNISASNIPFYVTESHTRPSITDQFEVGEDGLRPKRTSNAAIEYGPVRGDSQFSIPVVVDELVQSSQECNLVGTISTSHYKPNYVCRTCSENFSSRTSLHMHMKIRHRNHQDLGVACQKCGKAFSSKGDLNHHMMFHSEDQDPHHSDQSLWQTTKQTVKSDTINLSRNTNIQHTADHDRTVTMVTRSVPQLPPTSSSHLPLTQLTSQSQNTNISEHTMSRAFVSSSPTESGYFITPRQAFLSNSETRTQEVLLPSYLSSMPSKIPPVSGMGSFSHEEIMGKHRFNKLETSMSSLESQAEEHQQSEINAESIKNKSGPLDEPYKWKVVPFATTASDTSYIVSDDNNLREIAKKSQSLMTNIHITHNPHLSTKIISQSSDSQPSSPLCPVLKNTSTDVTYSKDRHYVKYSQPNSPRKHKVELRGDREDGSGSRPRIHAVVTGNSDSSSGSEKLDHVDEERIQNISSDKEFQHGQSFTIDKDMAKDNAIEITFSKNVKENLASPSYSSVMEINDNGMVKNTHTSVVEEDQEKNIRVHRKTKKNATSGHLRKNNCISVSNVTDSEKGATLTTVNGSEPPSKDIEATNIQNFPLDHVDKFEKQARYSVTNDENHANFRPRRSSRKRIVKFPWNDDDNNVSKHDKLEKVPVPKKNCIRKRSSKLHSCPLCQYSTVHSGDLKKHVPRHSKAKFACETCNMPFLLPGNYHRHLLSHGIVSNSMTVDVSQKIAAAKVQKSVKEAAEVTTQSYTIGNRAGRKTYECTKCDWSAFHAGDINRHLARHSMSKFECPLCSRPFLRAGKLKQHMLIHEGKSDEGVSAEVKKSGPILPFTSQHSGPVQLPAPAKKFLCDCCSYKTAHKGDLSKHKKRHLEAKLSCPTCNMPFKLKGNYEKHLKSHMSRVQNVVKPLNADLCSTMQNPASQVTETISRRDSAELDCAAALSELAKVSASSSSNIRVDLKLTPYACSICSYTTGDIADLRTHVEIIHQTKSLPRDLQKSSLGGILRAAEATSSQTMDKADQNKKI